MDHSGGGGSALLLRLFESDFFDVHLCVAYLKNYAHSIGITHYLVNRLRGFSHEDVEFYWPQLCYLVISRPTASVALETFILERCEEDAHIAVITLWYLQSSLSDLSSLPTSEQFAVCRRIFNRVQAIIFTDPPIPEPTTRPEPTIDDASEFERSTPANHDESELSLPPQKLNAPTAMFVGLGILAAAIGMPKLTAVSGSVAIEQARRVEQVSKSDKDEGETEDDNSGSDEEPIVSTSTLTLRPKRKAGSMTIQTGLPMRKNGIDHLQISPRRASTGRVTRRSKNLPNYLPGAPLEVSPNNLSSLTASISTKPQTRSHSFLPSALPPSPNVGVAGLDRSRSITTPRSPVSGKGNQPPSPGMGRRRKSAVPGSGVPLSSLSVPSLPATHHQSSPNHSNFYLSGTTLPGYGLPKNFLSKILLLQACRSQLDLLRSLQDISTRLVLVPKPARLSSLRAELTVLNHGLPRGCSLGMSSRNFTPTISLNPKSNSVSSSTEIEQKKKKKSLKVKAQARIVRISPSESVVLNSADRAPYVIHVEVLEGDLDFDPDRRQNAEDLRRALQEREGNSSSSIVAASSHNKVGRSLDHGSASGLNLNRHNIAGSPPRSNNSSSRDVSRRLAAPSPRLMAEDFGDIASASASTSKRDDSGLGLFESDLTAEPEGEMDLVEQLYGDISIHDTPVTNETAVDEEIHNKSVDEQAWARSSTPSTEVDKHLSVDSPDRPVSPIARTSSPNGGVMRPPLSSSNSSSAKPGGRSISSRPAISLDDYAERMRMAAVMLAQLDASQTATRGVVAKGTAAAGTLVGLPVATVAGIGGVVGAGLGAVASRFPFGSGKIVATSQAMQAAAVSANSEGQIGQASSGHTTSSLDTASAAEGGSAVSGRPSIAPGVVATGPSALQQPRQRLLAPAEATMIRERIMSEMMALEEERMARMREDGRARAGWSTAATGSNAVEDGAVVMRAVNKDDPSGAVFRESFADKTARIRAASPYGHLANWNVISVIVKTGADLRQEQFAIQLVKEFGRIWHEEKCPAWVCYFRILVTSEQSGLMETITDAVSIHSIKKDAYTRTAADGTQVFTSFTLYDHFIDTYGKPSSGGFRKAQDAFVKSLASYSVICYLLQLKDRHNGNILVDREGHLIHIDFGFLLSNSPGSLGFEMAPFKLPQDYIDILGGFDSEKWREFKQLFKRSFRAARKHAERIITLVELMQKDSKLDCFANGELTSQQLRERFMLSLTSTQIDEYAEKLIINAATSSFTRLYDLFQGYSNGIL